MDFPVFTIIVVSLYFLVLQCNTAIVPPPWSDPNKNPCAALPGGWQLLYWEPLQKCFKIFTIGYPCPDTMELSPIASSQKLTMMNSAAECRCPPGTAQFNVDSLCYTLYERGPCELGEYFSPVPETGRNSITKKRWGTCQWASDCQKGMIYWPQDSKCYSINTRGPCPKGKLIVTGKNQLSECLCENNGELAQFYYNKDDTCYEHYTYGPCENGRIFLPNRTCGCDNTLPNYYQETDQCYEIDTIGPCPKGHIFKLYKNNIDKQHKHQQQATCQCKENYILWKDGYCYRKYTRGPCENGYFLLNTTDCVENPCGKNKLYFPQHNMCYRIGSQGPCPIHQVVVFDFTIRPSIDGISYNGVCGCMGIIANLDQKCSEEEKANEKRIEASCESTMHGTVKLNGNCYKLYSRGPCGPGQWIEPKKIINRNDKRGAECQCRPGYKRPQSINGADDTLLRCYAPSVSIARYLNGRNHNNKSYKFGFRRITTSYDGNND